MRSGIETGTSRLPVLRAEPLGPRWGSTPVTETILFSQPQSTVIYLPQLLLIKKLPLVNYLQLNALQSYFKNY